MSPLPRMMQQFMETPHYCLNGERAQWALQWAAMQAMAERRGKTVRRHAHKAAERAAAREDMAGLKHHLRRLVAAAPDQPAP